MRRGPMISNAIRSVAMIEPLGDYGIGGYAYELAEGLVANGVGVDIYTNPSRELGYLPLPRRHRLLPALGLFAFRQKDLFRRGAQFVSASGPGDSAAESKSGPPLRAGIPLYLRIRERLLPIELAVHMKISKYDLVWTQWLLPKPYSVAFLKHCRQLGIRVVHTVHNVLPHEPRPGDMATYGALYRNCDFLIVHSESARDCLLRTFPKLEARIIVSSLGLYTMFPRVPGSRSEVRQRLEIRDDQPTLLFYGGVRPYKNIDAVLEALRAPALKDAVLIVAGREMCYEDLVPGKPLGRTRRKAEQLGISDRVRLIGGTLSLRETAEIFEAADAVLLPYIESYGSALLLLSMTFGKYVVATQTGGMDEYLARYPRHVLVDEPIPASLAEGIRMCIARLASDGKPCEAPRIPELEWPQIAHDTLRKISASTS